MPANLRVRAIQGGLEIRSPSRRIFILAGVIFGIAGGVCAFGAVTAAFFAFVPAVALLALALHIVVRPTRLVFARDRFTCGRLVHLTADIASFDVDGDSNARIALVTKAGARLRLPVSLDDISVTVHPGDGGAKRAFGATRREIAEDVVRCLEEALDEVRSAPAMFRIAASGPRIAEERTEASERHGENADEDELRRRGAS